MAKSYPSDWDKRRKTVYRRDDYTCQNCGRQGGSNGGAELHAHHIVPKSKGGTHSTSNLVAVCQQCHNAIHGNSHAPSSSASVPNQSSSSGYFDEVSTLIGNAAKFSEPAARYLPLVERMVDGGIEDTSKMELLEKKIQRQSIKQKAELASFDTSSAPNGVHEGLIDTLDGLFSVRIDLVDETQKLIEDVQENREKFVSSGELECPSCGDIVAREDAFCGSCGEDLSEVGVCPDCQSKVSVGDDFCTDCGTSLGGEDSAETKEKIGNRIREQVDVVENLAPYVTIHNFVITAHAGAVVNSERTEEVKWEYCPNCGFKHSVFKLDKAECVICGAKWEKKGILSKKWQMTDGEAEGESYPDAEWESFGEDRHQSEKYDEFITGEGADTTAINQRASKFSN